MTTLSKHLEYLILISTLLSIGCGSRPQTSTAEKVDLSSEPAYTFEKNGPLKSATIKPELPLLRAPDSRMLNTCFTDVKKPMEWQTANPKVQRILEQHRPTIEQSIISWLQTEVFKESGSSIALRRHEITFDKPVVRHVPNEQMAFRAEQNCLQGGMRDFPIESDVVSTLFGVKELHMESRRPIDKPTIKKMKKAARQARIRLVTENAYTPALDDNGKPLKNEQGKKLFNSPSGKRITKKEMPPPKDRLVVKWKLIFPKPIFLAYGTQPKNGWRKTPATPPHCEVFLVFDDIKPRIPICTTFDRAGFGVARSDKEGEVVVKIATENNTVAQSLPYGSPSMVVADDTLIVWITPTPVEEGARLRVDALWLDVGNASPKIEAFVKKSKKGKGPTKNKSDKAGDKQLPPPMGY